MELHQLRYAVEVHRKGSFTAAAEALHVSQSGVSAQVAKLERELGVRLFQRGSRSATLTPDGAVLLPKFRATLDSVAGIHAAADEMAGLVRGQVRIGAVIGCTIPGYLSAFADFRASTPGVTVTASEGNSDDLLSQLLRGDLDLALIAHADVLPPELDVITLIEEPITAGVAPGHPWATKASVPMAELAQVDVLTLPVGTGVRGVLQAACKAVGIDVEPVVQAHSPEAVLSLAMQGAGVAVLSDSMLAEPLVRVALEGVGNASLSLAAQREPGAAARAFLRTLRSSLVPES